MPFDTYVVVPGSEKSAHPLAVPVSPVDPTRLATITLILKVPYQQISSVLDSFAATYNLVGLWNPNTPNLYKLTGTLLDLQRAFRVSFMLYNVPNPNGSNDVYRGRTGAIYVPTELADALDGVFGLDDRPQARPHFRTVEGVVPRANGSFTVPQLARIYNFPTNVNGSGQCVAIIELGGGYQSSDMDAYFQALGMQTPNIIPIGVDGGGNTPGDAADGEVVLDIQIVGAVANGAKICVYFAPNTDAGFLDAIYAAIHDNVNKPVAISISWGSAEANWTAQAMNAMNQAFAAANAAGITVFAAAGDNGSQDGMSDGKQHADFPASAPNCVGCGGTTLIANGTSIVSETVWHNASGGATGGGYSTFFPRPTWQSSANNQAQRGVPDVAAVADPNTGYQIFINGQWAQYGGTSAVAPLWSGLTALLVQKLTRALGALNPLIYAGQVPASFLDITTGSNGAYGANTGWDACTGLGSPNGIKLLTALTPSQGNPNPPPVNNPPPVSTCREQATAAVNSAITVARADSAAHPQNTTWDASGIVWLTWFRDNFLSGLN